MAQQCWRALEHHSRTSLKHFCLVKKDERKQSSGESGGFKEKVINVDKDMCRERVGADRWTQITD